MHVTAVNEKGMNLKEQGGVYGSLEGRKEEKNDVF